MRDAFETLFFDPMTLNFKNFGDLLMNFMNRILDAMANQLAEFWAKSLMRGMGGSGVGGGASFIGSLGSDLFSLFGGESGMFFHAGGVVGVDSPRWATVPAGTFERAPRLHKGLAADEFPAILQSGETVIPRGGGGGANQLPPIVIQAVDAKSFHELCRSNPQAIFGPLMQMLEDNNGRKRIKKVLDR